MSSYSTPINLALAVSNYLVNPTKKHNDFRNGIELPPITISNLALESLFTNLFDLSLETEEGQVIRIEVVYLPKHLNNSELNGWQAFPFEQDLQLTRASLLKLARATDIKTSAIAVAQNQVNEIVIWGLVDQRDLAYRYLHQQMTIRENNPCGYFESTIVGPGHLRVTSEGQLIAELKISALQIGNRGVNIFQRGPIASIINRSSSKIASLILAELKDKEIRNVFGGETECVDLVKSSYVRAISSLLIRIQSYRHGGALLLIENSKPSHLDVKYSLEYPRIKNGIVAENIDFLTLCDTEDDDVEAFLKRLISSPTHQNDESLNSSLWFAASLSKIDGLILMDSCLVVKGFGVIIGCGGEELATDQVYRATTTSGVKQLQSFDYTSLGTRHRSMMTYCFSHRKTVGFVISQDGDIRAMCRVGKRLVVWENIQVLNLL